jgi:hypothetical protein
MILILVLSINLNSQEKDEYQDKIDELMEVMNLNSSVPQILDVMRTQLSSFPQLSDIYETPMMEKLQEKLKEKLTSRMGEEYAKIYAKYFSLEDIQNMINFYKSETGKKFIENQVSIFTESMQLGQNIVFEIMEEIHSDIDTWIEEIKKEEKIKKS